MDPLPNANSHDGRTVRRDMRAKTDSRRLAIVKRPQDQYLATEMYSIGMERVGYALGVTLGLPVPETHLDEVDGYASSVQRRIVHVKTWRQLGSAPMMRDNVENSDLYPLAALFDVWLANIDRRGVNLLYEALPEGNTPGKARGSRMWLIDHGHCGLWPTAKFDPDKPGVPIPTDPAQMTGLLDPRGEQAIGFQMPDAYEAALKNTVGDLRDQLLDRIGGVGDDAIEQVVNEVPEAYITAAQGAATVAFLKARRDTLDKVLDQYW